MPTPKRLRTYLFTRKKGRGPSIAVFLSDPRDLLSVSCWYDLPHIARNINGISWGKDGSINPFLSAEAVLSDFFGEPTVAYDLARAFKESFIAQMPEKGGMITTEQINAWFTRYKSKLEA